MSRALEDQIPAMRKLAIILSVFLNRRDGAVSMPTGPKTPAPKYKKKKIKKKKRKKQIDEVKEEEDFDNDDTKIQKLKESIRKTPYHPNDKNSRLKKHFSKKLGVVVEVEDSETSNFEEKNQSDREQVSMKHKRLVS